MQVTNPGGKSQRLSIVVVWGTPGVHHLILFECGGSASPDSFLAGPGFSSTWLPLTFELKQRSLQAHVVHNKKKKKKRVAFGGTRTHANKVDYDLDVAP